MLISFAVPDGLQGDTLQNKMQLIGTDLHAFGIQVKRRYFKGSLFETPIEDGKAALFIDQHLQVGTGLVDENKSIALRNLPAQLIEDDAAQQVEAFTHIGFFSIEVISSVVTQRNKAAHDNSSFR